MSRQSLFRTGISEAEAKRRLARHGANELPSGRARGVWAIAAEVVREPMFLLLVVGAALYFVLGDWSEALILLVSVLVVMGITIYQERRTEFALEALRDLSSPRALVIRDGEPRRVSGREVVPGDLVLLQEGDRVPADGVLLECNQFSVDESLLTGESLPVSKRVAENEIAEIGTPGGEGLPFVYSGSLVVQGQGLARVLATGLGTQIGKIGRALQELEVESSPLQLETRRLVRVFAALGMALCVLVVVLYAQLRGGWLQGLLAGITLAMAVLPEEFPVVLTVFLALGAWRISQKHVLTRRMPAIETLGSATVLCVDKTGTLTQNRMVIAELTRGDQVFESRGGPLPPHLRPLVRAAALACELNPSDPMEQAILRYATDADAETADLRERWTLVREYDLSSELLAVTHCWQRREGGEVRVASKGAPEAVVKLCRAEPSLRQAILDRTVALAARGRRVLAVAEAMASGDDLPGDPTAFVFSYLGLVALADPVRPTVSHALAECAAAGVRVVMITGDYPGTAEAIAREIGLASPGGVVTGQELATMDEETLRSRTAQANIFARVAPEQKLMLVRALKDNGEVVAMTGDGVNDAPALKAAHIGVAMGGRGTDVAREAASLVLLEDDFDSIVETIRLGRRIYANIRNAMSYLVAVHVPTAGLALVPLVLGWPLVFFPVHIVFLEFVIDPACSIAFEAEPADPGGMKQPPRRPGEPLFSAKRLGLALLQGLAGLGAITVLYRFILAAGFDDAHARATAFAAIVIGNCGMILSNRSQSRSLLATVWTPNPAVWWLVAGALAGLALALYAPALRRVFLFAPLSWSDWLMAAVAGSAGVVSFELVKLLASVRPPRRP
jgi:P-type Ca2+ transporter type 2C